jgi:hypothetical protein
MHVGGNVIELFLHRPLVLAKSLGVVAVIIAAIKLLDRYTSHGEDKD